MIAVPTQTNVLLSKCSYFYLFCVNFFGGFLPLFKMNSVLESVHL